MGADATWCAVVASALPRGCGVRPHHEIELVRQWVRHVGGDDPLRVLLGCHQFECGGCFD